MLPTTETHFVLVPTIVVGDLQMLWSAKSDAGRLAPEIPPSDLWASGSNGTNQMGCVGTTQGSEFDYVGVMWGRDLNWDPATDDWIGDPSHSHDGVNPPSSPNWAADAPDSALSRS